jgi:chemotaxis protein CheC
MQTFRAEDGTLHPHLAVLQRLVCESWREALRTLQELVGPLEVETGPVCVEVVDRDRMVGALAPADESMVAVGSLVGGPIRTRLLMLWRTADAINAAAALGVPPTRQAPCAGAAAQQTNGMGELGRSALAEMGNIVGSAFLTALAARTRLRLIPSAPLFGEGTAGAALEQAGGIPDAGQVALLRSRFLTRGDCPFGCSFFVIVEPYGLKAFQPRA